MPAKTARERARAEITGEIKEAARRRIAAQGAVGLSLRAVARDVGLVSSAVYRYFPSRDDLITALLVDAYNDIGRAAEEALAATPADDPAARWRAVTRAIRHWALAHRHEYALLYGSPVPGYRAPELTIGPASRVTGALASVVADAARAGDLTAGSPAPALPPALRDELVRVADVALPGSPPDVVFRALVAWTQVFGLVSFELFGHLENVVEDRVTFFDRATAAMAGFVGLPAG
ncbi:MAG TPA: TetR/AcrR family transcriptional regulator [Acidimicrobiales bacterium]|nr:TetR/AcrR family transcriptional regulator [Acidimicrobiales bacterium]